MRILREPSAEEQTEFMRLRSNRLLVRYLQSCLTTADKALRKVPDNGEFHTMQGQAQTLEHILSIIDPESAKP